MKDTSVYRVSVPKFETMIASGAFGEDRVELLGGILTMMTTSPEHDHAVIALGEELRDRLSRETWTVREEKPILLGAFWRPIPDLAVVRGDRRSSSRRTPRRRDIALLVEVSDTTYAKDTGKKLRRYERSGIPAYWVVDLSRRRVEVREMTARGLTLAATYGEADLIPLTVDGVLVGEIPVQEFMP